MEKTRSKSPFTSIVKNIAEKALGGEDKLPPPSKTPPPFNPEWESKLEGETSVLSFPELEVSLKAEQLKSAKLEQDVKQLSEKLRELELTASKQNDKSANAFGRVADVSVEQDEAIRKLQSEMAGLKEFIVKAISREGKSDESKVVEEKVDEEEEFYDLPNGDDTEGENQGTGKHTEKRMSGETKDSQRLEALKQVRNLVSADVEDKHIASWVDESAYNIRRYFPRLSDQDIAELLTLRLPRKFGRVTRGMHSCRDLKDFKSRVLTLCSRTYNNCYDSMTEFLNFSPKKVGPNTVSFRALIIEILDEAEPMLASSDTEVSEDIRKNLVLQKIKQFLPYSVGEKIRVEKLRYKPPPILDDLNSFLCCPDVNREVERYLKTLKNESKSKMVASVEDSEEKKENKSKVFHKKFPKGACRRCGSALHISNSCPFYNSYSGEHCRPCFTAAEFKLYHDEKECLLSKK